MSPEATRIVEDYLRRLRRALRGVTPDVADEVTREIRAHIDDALSARGSGTVGDLLDVLDRLGPPEDYARDLGLYLMVDRGYREWSLPHMVRSTAFWALSTVVGAVVVMVFGLLYGLSAGLLLAGLQRALAPGLVLPLPQVLPGWPGPMLALAGLLGLVGVTVVVRWFIGQYVVSARPHTLGAADADSGWVDRTSRRIVALAMAGLTLLLVTALAGDTVRLRAGEQLRLPEDFIGGPFGWLGLGGAALLLLSPVLGLLWTALSERSR